MKPKLLSLILSYCVASATATILVVLTFFWLASFTGEQTTIAWALPIIAAYVFGYCLIACALLTPLILLVLPLVRKMGRFRWLVILTAGVILGFLAACPLVQFQRTDALFHFKDERISEAQISIYLLMIGSVAGLAASLVVMLTDLRHPPMSRVQLRRKINAQASQAGTNKAGPSPGQN